MPNGTGIPAGIEVGDFISSFLQSFLQTRERKAAQQAERDKLKKETLGDFLQNLDISSQDPATRQRALLKLEVITRGMNEETPVAPSYLSRSVSKLTAGKLGTSQGKYRQQAGQVGPGAAINRLAAMAHEEAMRPGFTTRTASAAGGQTGEANLPAAPGVGQPPALRLPTMPALGLSVSYPGIPTGFRKPPSAVETELLRLAGETQRETAAQTLQAQKDRAAELRQAARDSEQDERQAKRDAAALQRQEEHEEAMAKQAEANRIAAERRQQERDATMLEAILNREQIKADDLVRKRLDRFRDDASRYTLMQAQLPSALAGNQQAMVALLANHVGMTLGLQKGARINQTQFNEAQRSAPFLERVGASFGPDGYLTGVTLTPDQMQQMVGLAKDRLDQSRKDVTEEARDLGVDLSKVAPGFDRTVPPVPDISGRQVTVNVGGKPYVFPDQASADAFKKEARIP